MKLDADVFGRMLFAHFSEKGGGHVIERSDGHVDPFSGDEYFKPFWGPGERRAMALVRGRVLDIGCGAGRHALPLQKRGLKVTGIDSSALAIDVCRRRGLKDARILPIEHLKRLAPGTYDTVIMFGNNFGLFGSFKKAQRLLRDLLKVTTPEGQILAYSLDVRKTSNPEHLAYHRWNRSRGRLPGQIRMRVRFGGLVGPWFDWLMVGPQEMRKILIGTGWRLAQVLPGGGPSYLAVLKKSQV